MKKLITIISFLSITACANTNQKALNFQAINFEQNKNSFSTAPLLVHQFSNLCLNNTNDAKKLIKAAHSADWNSASQKTLQKEGLAKLKKTTLKIPGGGTPVEESQIILTKSFENKIYLLEISERFDRKRLTSTNCTLYSKQDDFLKNCTSLGELINRPPDQNTKYKESKAHFISWNASLSSKRARIKCQHTPHSPTLPYEGTQLSVGIDHITPIKPANLKKSNQQRFDVSER